MDHRDLATDLLRTARAKGASAADVLVAEGTEFSVTVRKGEVETLTEAGSKALGVRVFVGRRTASTYTSDFSWPTLQRLVEETVGMARATYLQKIAVRPEDITQTLTMGVTIDHIFSISVALLGGFIWVTWGYQFVFLLGAAIAVLNFFSALRVKTNPT